MSWFKKLIEKFTIGSAGSCECCPEEVIEEVKYTNEQLMSMTKKEQLAFAAERGIEVKDHWTKKNIAKEILANL